MKEDRIMWTERCPTCQARVARLGRPNQKMAADFETTIVCHEGGKSHTLTTKVTEHEK